MNRILYISDVSTFNDNNMLSVNAISGFLVRLCVLLLPVVHVVVQRVVVGDLVVLVAVAGAVHLVGLHLLLVLAQKALNPLPTPQEAANDGTEHQGSNAPTNNGGDGEAVDGCAAVVIIRFLLPILRFH